MLAPAHVGHLALLRSLIRQNAADGSFDSGLAADSTQSVEFFDKLRRALVHGYFIEEDLKTGRLESIAAGSSSGSRRSSSDIAVAVMDAR